MKMPVQHLVPLSRQALELLQQLRHITGHTEYLFPAHRLPDRPMPGNALATALRSLGFHSEEMTPHGFRTTACTLLNELGWRPDAIERQLAHADTRQIRRIYNHAHYLPERREMMQSWADYLDGLRKPTAST